MSEAIVVSGGIGGLTVAVALTRSDWRVEVLERRPVFTESGAGLSLWPNALDAIGLGDPDGRHARLTMSRRAR